MVEQIDFAREVGRGGLNRSMQHPERYNRTVRYDWLRQYLFESIAEVQAFATHWLWTYTHEHSNMVLGDISPKQKLARATEVPLLSVVTNGGITIRLIGKNYNGQRHGGCL